MRTGVPATRARSIWWWRGEVQHWRQMAGYQERLSLLSEVLDGCEPRTLQVVLRR